MIKISSKTLTILPYLSTAWKNINSLFLENNLLIALLYSGERIAIPNLDSSMIEKIFFAHHQFLEQGMQNHAPFTPPSTSPTLGMQFPLRFGTGGIEALGSALQHNPEQSNAPDLPPEVLSKIAAIAKILDPSNLEEISSPEPHCNCFYCQIAKSVQGKQEKEAPKGPSEEVVTEEDLRFRQWNIEHIGEQLYRVTSPFDKNEHYEVFLGEPLGCTCGEKNCEHIRSVLNS